MIRLHVGKNVDSDVLMSEILTTSIDLKKSLKKPDEKLVDLKKKEKETAQTNVNECRTALREAKAVNKKKQKELTEAKRGNVSIDKEEVSSLMFKKANLIGDFKFIFCKKRKGVVSLKYSEEMRKGKAKMKGNTPTQSKPTTTNTPIAKTNPTVVSVTSAPPPVKFGGSMYNTKK